MGTDMAAISAIGGVQHPQPAPNVQAPREKEDPVTEQKKVNGASDSQRAEGGLKTSRSATGDAVAATLAAQSEPAELDQEQQDDAVKRELIAKIFKISEETDLKSLFGDFQISQENKAKSKNFLNNLENIRPPVPQPSDAISLSTKI